MLPHIIEYAPAQVCALLILYATVAVKELHDLGRLYPWQKPTHCPSCRSDRLWGHGFVLRYFEPFHEAFFIKRYRCPGCNAVHTLRPKLYPQGCRYPLVVMLQCLMMKTETDHWSDALPRQLQQAWWRAALQAVRVAIREVRYLLAWLLLRSVGDVLLL